jgi:hypothetical protein
MTSEVTLMMRERGQVETDFYKGYYTPNSVRHRRHQSKLEVAKI